MPTNSSATSSAALTAKAPASVAMKASPPVVPSAGRPTWNAVSHRGAESGPGGSEAALRPSKRAAAAAARAFCAAAWARHPPATPAEEAGPAAGAQGLHFAWDALRIGALLLHPDVLAHHDEQTIVVRTDRRRRR